jgi:hypothetical protein
MSKASLVISSALVAVGLSACGIADHFNAQNRMEKSQDAYRTCLGTHTSDAGQCDTLKAFYDADKAAYEN